MERGADLHMFQLMPLPLTVSCFSKIQIGFTFLVPAHLGSLGQRAVKRVCVCVCVTYLLTYCPPPVANLQHKLTGSTPVSATRAGKSGVDTRARVISQRRPWKYSVSRHVTLVRTINGRET